MTKRVWFEKGIICQQVDKSGLTVDTLKEDLVKLLEFQAELKKQNAPLYILYDAANALSADSATRQQAIYVMSCLNYQKVAVFGIRSVFMKYIAKFVIAGIRKREKIKIFDSKEQAEHWLRLGNKN